MTRIRLATFLCWVLALVSSGPLSAAPGALPSPIIVHSELEISLFAMEPDVVDPVALCFDTAGRMYVVEMRDYPYGIPPDNKPGGTVRLLEDTDHDGRADRSVVFAEGLNFPTSIAPHRDGVIVMAPPEILFLKDTNGDGKADVREVLFKGFHVGVTDGNMSGLRWGLDNWLHGVNSGHGGSVYSTRNPVDPVRLGDLDFRMRPDTGTLETTYSTGGGFGLVFDDWGRSFTPYNVDHMQMRIVPARTLGRYAGSPPTKGTRSISDHEAMARIFPISVAQTRPNHPEQAGYFSAAGGVGFIGHQGYPGDLAGSVTVGDMVGQLVHRDVLSEDGPIFKASRPPGEQTKEFIASTDLDFRPTGLELGPDGALYLMDMHRAVIEHPDYIPKKMLESMDVRAGDQHGRIYRILPTSGVRQNQSPLAPMTPTELVEELASPNQWRRMTAQRLIVEQNHLIASVPLQQVVRTHVNPVARVHALWALAGIGELGESLLLNALEDGDPGVLENALQLANGFTPDSDEVRERAFHHARNGASPRLRFVALQALAGMDAGRLREAVGGVLKLDGAFPWSRRVALAALPTGELPLLETLLADKVFAQESFAPLVFTELADLAGARMNADQAAELRSLFVALAGPSVADTNRLAVLRGFQTGLTRRSGKDGNPAPWAASLDSIAAQGTPAVHRAVWSIQKQLGLAASPSQRTALATALTIAPDRSLAVVTRLDAIRLLTLGDSSTARPVLFACLASIEPIDIQRAALDGLRSPTDPVIAEELINRWRGLHPGLKRDVVLFLLRQRDYHEPLLRALEDGRLTVGELNLDLEDRRRLLRWSSPAIQARAARLLGDGEYGNRQQKVDEWLAKLPKDGDATRGKTVFESTCAPCHRAGQLGHEVGPNLSGLAHRSVEDLVANILDPNMAINPSYLSLAAETRDGEIITGILTAETPETLSLLQAGGLRTDLKRDQLTRLESTGTSLMPEGLEATLSPQSLRDLVDFLQQP